MACPEPVIAALLLAAGAGRRLGGRKLELPWGSTTLLDHVLASLQAVALSDVVCVLGHEPERLQPLVEARGARYVVNWSPTTGMLDSVRCGLRALEPVDAALILPADCPVIRPESLAQVAGAFAGRDALVIPTYEGRRGHPVLLGADLFGAVLHDDLPAGLRDLRERIGVRAHLLPVDDPGVLVDVDTPEDYARWAGRVAPP